MPSRLPAYKTMKTLVIDLISIKKFALAYGHFLNNNYPALTTLSIGTEHLETIAFLQSGESMQSNIILPIPPSSNITTLCLDILPEHIAVLELFLALPLLRTVSITRVVNCPSIFDKTIIPHLEHARGEVAFINALISTHNLQSIHTYFGDEYLLQQFLSASSGKSISQFYYEAHLVVPGYSPEIVNDDISFIKGILHNGVTDIMMFHIFVESKNLASNTYLTIQN
jgi:hypothetical protein